MMKSLFIIFLRITNNQANNYKIRNYNYLNERKTHAKLVYAGKHDYLKYCFRLVPLFVNILKG